MERPEFDIRIDRRGKVHVDIKGVKGQRCVELADLIQEIVGAEQQRVLKPEAHDVDGKVRIDTQVRRS